MTSKGMMDPRYTRAVKSTENVFTPRELQMMDINPKNLMKAECTPYFEDNYTDKIKLKNTVIKNADAGLYEFFAKEVECSAKFIRGKERIKEALKKTINAKKKDDTMNSTKSKKELNKKIIDYEKEMIVIFRKMSKICQNKAKGLCDIRDKSDDQYTKEALKELLMDEKSGDQKSNEEEINAKIEKMNENEVREKIKRNNPRFKHLLELSDEELGLGRKMLLMINGFIRKGDNWKYDPKLEERFFKAASICRNKKLCVKTEFADIPKEISSFTDAILDGISAPYYYLSDKGTKMLDVSKQKGIEKYESSMAASDAKIEKLEAERKALDEAKKKATETVDSKSASAADKAKAQASINAIEKREKRLDEGKNFSIRNLSRAKKSVSALKLNKASSQYKMDKLKLQKESLTQKLETPKKSFLSKMAKKTNNEIASQQALKQSFKNLKGTKRNTQLDILKAKSNKEGVALSLSQAQKRARLQYNKNNPGIGISYTRHRGIQREKAKQGQADLNKYKNIKKTGKLSNSQQARMNVLEKGKFRMGVGENSVKKLKEKTETSNEKTNRLSKEREKLIEKAKNPQQNFSKNNSKRLRRLQYGTRRLGFGAKSVLKRQGKSKNNRILERMKTKKNIMDTGQQRTKKDTEKMEKLDKNITKLEAKLEAKKTNINKKLLNNKTKRNNLLEQSKKQELSKSEKAQLSKLQYGTRRLGYGAKSIASREGKNKTVRNKEASAARLGALEAKQLTGTPLSKNNKAELYGTWRKKSLYKRSGMNRNATKKAQFNQLNKIKRKGDFTEKGSWGKNSDQKRYRQLKDEILKGEGKSRLTRKIMRKEQEAESLKAQQQLGVMGQESSKRLNNLTKGVKRFPRLGLGTKKKSLNQLRKNKAENNVRKIKGEVVRNLDIERQRLLAEENGNNTEA